MRSFHKGAFLLAALGVSSASMAAVYTFTPSPADLYDLDHYKYYTWGFDVNIPQNEVITGATLTFTDIWNWENEPNVLYTHMLDDAPLGVRVLTDNQGGGNAFSGQGTKVGQWSDPVGGVDRNFNLVYNFGTMGQLDELRTYVADGRLGFGFDPDCHYWNDGVKFTITTSSVPGVPGPGAAVVMLSSLVGMKLRARRRSRV